MTSKQSAIVRRARAEDVDQILNLLTEYELPRGYFEPAYSADPTYFPEHSWVLESEGQLAAHARIFDRRLRWGSASLHVAGIGNVITAPALRGRGYAGRLLRAVLSDAAEQGFAYALLGTDLRGMYERFGFAQIHQDSVRAALRPTTPVAVNTAVFQPLDLPEVMRLFDDTNAGRTGPTLRSPDYWRGQLAWLDEDPHGFLLARRDDGSLSAYVRSRAVPTAVHILELTSRPHDFAIAHDLLQRVAEGRGAHIMGHFPPSMLRAMEADELEIDLDVGLMGRVVNLDAFLRTLEPELTRRLAAANVGGGACQLATSAGTAELRIDQGRVVGLARALDDGVDYLDEYELGHLLFHGYDAAALELFESRGDKDLLKALFPAQDFVLWLADAF